VNFQNVPRDSDVVKRAFIPKRGAFSFFDYGSIEPRLAAYFSSKLGYDEFAQQIRDGSDPYTAVAQLVTGQTEIDKDERTKWKVMFLSLMYGGGMRTIQLQFDVSAAEAKRRIKTFHTNFPFVDVLHAAVQASHRRRGYIIGLDGRHLHAEEYGEHKLLNKLIQGSAAGLMKQALLNVHRWILKDSSDDLNKRARYGDPLSSRMVSVIHDEIIFDGPVSELATLNKKIPPLMIVRQDVHEIVPIVVDHEISLTTWADKGPYVT